MKTWLLPVSPGKLNIKYYKTIVEVVSKWFQKLLHKRSQNRNLFRRSRSPAKLPKTLILIRVVKTSNLMYISDLTFK
jgi:hypothetical protein